MFIEAPLLGAWKGPARATQLATPIAFIGPRLGAPDDEPRIVLTSPWLWADMKAAES